MADARLVAAYQQQMHRIRQRAGLVVGGAWAALGSYDLGDVDRFLARAVPAAEAAQRAAGISTVAFLSASTGSPRTGVDPGAFTGEQLRGVAPAEVYRRPFVTMWGQMAKGTSWEDARRMGGDRAARAAADDVQLAMRAAAAAWAAHHATRRWHYRRTVTGVSCELCTARAGVIYRTPDAVPLHSGCDCTVEAVAPSTRSFEHPDDGVAVHTHGELGQVLAVAGDHFAPAPALVG